MNRLAAAAVFLLAYPSSIYLATLAHATLGNPMVGVGFIVVVYTAFFTPAAVVALASFLYPAFVSRTRLALALGFAALFGLALHAFLLAAESERLHRFIMRNDLASFVLLSIVLSASFVGIAAVTRKQALSSASLPLLSSVRRTEIRSEGE